MRKTNKIFIKLIPIIFLAFFFSCDFFAPYDLEFVGISNDTLKFDLFEQEKQFIISYADSFDVKWEITPDVEWIQISPDSGIINIDSPDTITVKLLRSGIEPGDYNYNLEINFQNKTSSKTVNVKMEIKALAEISDKTLNFGFSDSLNSFNIRNIGNYPFKWKFVADREWISVRPDTGTLSIDSTNFLSKLTDLKKAFDKSDTSITVKIDNRKLSTGDNTGKIFLYNNVKVMDSINVTASKKTAPLLSVSHNKLDFGAAEIIKRIQISNRGTGVLNWSASTSETWITLTPPSDSISTGTQELNVAVLRLGLQPGSYAANIIINSNGGNLTIPVSMTVIKSPALNLSLSSLSFTNENREASFEITNTGEGELNWNIRANQSWIQVSPTGGSTSTEKDTINVTVNTNGLSPGTYTGSVLVSSDFGNESIQITLVITGSPQILISPLALDFGENELSKVFEIINEGDADLTWELFSDQTWIEIAVTSGTAEPKSKNEIEVKVSRNTLTPGNYSGNINIISNGGNASLRVSMNIVENPLLIVNPIELNFGDTETTKKLEIKNDGVGNLNWQITANVPWILIPKLNGSLLGNQNDVIDISINKIGLQPGNYNANISVSSNGGNVIIPVIMSVKDNSILSVSSNSLNFGEIDSLKTLEITNTGSGNLNWKATVNESWISLNPAEGTITQNQRNNVSVSISRKNLLPGNYSAIISITSNGGNENILVSMTVLQKATLSINPIELDFGKTNVLKILELNNNGDQILNWSLTSNASWLLISSPGGSIAGKQKISINVNVNRLGLDAGDYSSNIIINSSGGNFTIPVKMNVALSPKLSISPTSLSFTNLNTDASFEIRNQGDGQLNWQLSATKTWISVSLGSGNTTTEVDVINVSVNTIGLTPGTYTGNINVTSDYGNEIIQVTLIITGSAKILFTPNSLIFGGNDLSKVFEIINEGNADLIWQLTADQPWIDVVLKSGTAGPNLKNTVEVKVNRGTLPAGIYSGNIIITSNGGTGTIPVEMKVNEASKLSVNPTELDFGQTESLKTIEIINEGEANLNWSLTKNVSWLSTSLIAGTIGSKLKQDISITIVRNGLTPGDYSTNLIISSNGGNVTVPVKMSVKDNSKLSINPNSLNFGEIDSLKTLEITNIGTGNLNWKATVNESWISVLPDSGTLGTNQRNNALVNITRENLAPGNYSATITISSNGGNTNVQVTMSVPEVPNLSVSLTEINFGDSESEKSFTIQNSGSGTLTWSSEIMYITTLAENNWVSMNLTSGSITGSQSVTVTINRSDLQAGQHNADIQIYSNGGNATIHLYVTVTEPHLNVSTEIIEFNTMEEEKTFDIANTGSGELSWTISVENNFSSIQIITNLNSGTISAGSNTVRVVLQTNNQEESVSLQKTNQIVVGNIYVYGSNDESKTITVILNSAF